MSSDHNHNVSLDVNNKFPYDETNSTPIVSHADQEKIPRKKTLMMNSSTSEEEEQNEINVPHKTSKSMTQFHLTKSEYIHYAAVPLLPDGVDVNPNIVSRRDTLSSCRNPLTYTASLFHHSHSHGMTLFDCLSFNSTGVTTTNTTTTTTCQEITEHELSEKIYNSFSIRFNKSINYKPDPISPIKPASHETQILSNSIQNPHTPGRIDFIRVSSLLARRQQYLNRLKMKQHFLNSSLPNYDLKRHTIQQPQQAQPSQTQLFAQSMQPTNNNAPLLVKTNTFPSTQHPYRSIMPLSLSLEENTKSCSSFAYSHHQSTWNDDTTFNYKVDQMRKPSLQQQSSTNRQYHNCIDHSSYNDDDCCALSYNYENHYHKSTRTNHHLQGDTHSTEWNQHHHHQQQKQPQQPQHQPQQPQQQQMKHTTSPTKETCPKNDHLMMMMLMMRRRRRTTTTTNKSNKPICEKNENNNLPELMKTSIGIQCSMEQLQGIISSIGCLTNTTTDTCCDAAVQTDMDYTQYSYSGISQSDQLMTKTQQSLFNENVVTSSSSNQDTVQTSLDEFFSLSRPVSSVSLETLFSRTLRKQLSTSMIEIPYTNSCRKFDKRLNNQRFSMTSSISSNSLHRFDYHQQPQYITHHSQKHSSLYPFSQSAHPQYHSNRRNIRLSMLPTSSSLLNSDNYYFNSKQNRHRRLAVEQEGGEEEEHHHRQKLKDINDDDGGDDDEDDDDEDEDDDDEYYLIDNIPLIGSTSLHSDDSTLLLSHPSCYYEESLIKNDTNNNIGNNNNNNSNNVLCAENVSYFQKFPPSTSSSSSPQSNKRMPLSEIQSIQK
ncbi:unnamed protein product [Schistosoma turkestanicum]|nr:unnamed protein product [Schistosoma turkestanicum]